LELGKFLRNLFSFQEERERIGLALGGGGARGLAHLGVLQALEERSFSLDQIVGTSMGAIVGGAYAQGAKVEELIARFADYQRLYGDQQKEIERSLGVSPRNRFDRWTTSLSNYYFMLRGSNGNSLLDGDMLVEMTDFLLSETEIGDTQIPFAAVAVDIISGEELLLTEGPIREAVRASASMPGIFPPVEWEGRFLLDGGVTNLVPVDDVFALGADRVIAVDVGKEVDFNSLPNKGLDLLFRVSAIARHQLKLRHMEKADVIIRPEVEDFSWYDFSDYEEIIDRGRTATERAIADNEWLREEKVRSPR